MLKTIAGGVAFTAATFALQVWLTYIVLSWLFGGDGGGVDMAGQVSEGGATATAAAAAGALGSSVSPSADLGERGLDLLGKIMGFN